MRRISCQHQNYFGITLFFIDFWTQFHSIIIEKPMHASSRQAGRQSGNTYSTHHIYYKSKWGEYIIDIWWNGVFRNSNNNNHNNNTVDQKILNDKNSTRIEEIQEKKIIQHFFITEEFFLQKSTLSHWEFFFLTILIFLNLDFL